MAKTTKKQTRDSHLTDLEKLGGVILLLIYLALIPLCGAAILNWAGGRPDVKFCVSVFRQSQEWRWKTGRILAWIP